ncbi:hypothetical protein F5B17DRAFT_428195 [Nemania serpens]|nr:hypothetical protein F5B17DRAFT_428195 [Nemania serpens]
MRASDIYLLTAATVGSTFNSLPVALAQAGDHVPLTSPDGDNINSNQNHARRRPNAGPQVQYENPQKKLVGRREDGLVVLFDTSTAELQRVLYSHGRHLMVTHVSWSAGGCIANPGASSIIQVWAISQGADSTMRANQKVIEVKNPSSIRKHSTESLWIKAPGLRSVV